MTRRRVKRTGLVSKAQRFFFIACWIVLPVSAQPSPGAKRHVGEEPALAVQTTRDVGEVIYSKFDYVATSGVRLLDSFEGKELLRKIYLPRGTFLAARSAKGQVDLCTEPGLFEGFDEGEVVCFRDSDRDGRLEQLHIPGTRFGAWRMLKAAPLRYEEAIDLDRTKGFRRELLYDGLAGGVVRLGYREFIDNMARPAFQQDLTYTLEPEGPTDAAFRGARIRIHRASNQEISYEVVASLRD